LTLKNSSAKVSKNSKELVKLQNDLDIRCDHKLANIKKIFLTNKHVECKLMILSKNK